MWSIANAVTVWAAQPECLSCFELILCHLEASKGHLASHVRRKWADFAPIGGLKGPSCQPCKAHVAPQEAPPSYIAKHPQAHPATSAGGFWEIHGLSECTHPGFCGNFECSRCSFKFSFLSPCTWRSLWSSWGTHQTSCTPLVPLGQRGLPSSFFQVEVLAGLVQRCTKYRRSGNSKEASAGSGRFESSKNSRVWSLKRRFQKVSGNPSSPSGRFKEGTLRSPNSYS